MQHMHVPLLLIQLLGSILRRRRTNTFEKKKGGGLLKHLQWNLSEPGKVEDMTWQFTLSV